MFKKSIFILATVLSFAVVSAAQTQTPPTITPISLTSGATYTQNFDTLANTGTSSVVPPGFGFVESGTGANATYTANTGASNTGDTYSYGAMGATERAFGTLQSGSVAPLIGAVFTNNTGATVTSLTITYTLEQYRLGAARTEGVADRLDFQYSLTAANLTDNSFVDFNALDGTSPVTTGTVGPLDGNLDANRRVVTATISGISIPNGGTFAIRWNDFNVASSDDGLAVDDFSIAAVNPTAVKLENFAALAGRDGVRLVWETSYEVNNLGFNIYRERDGAQVKINSSIIAGTGLTALNVAHQAGASYAWHDAEGAAGDRYYLEDLDLSGERTLHDAVTPIVTDKNINSKSNAYTIQALNDAGVHKNSEILLPAPALRETNLTAQRDLAARAPVKITVNREGFYRVTRDQLIAAGLDANVDAARLQLFTNGIEQAINVATDANGKLAAPGIEFYGVRYVTAYESDARAYYLAIGDAAGKRIANSNNQNGTSGKTFFYRNAPRLGVRSSRANSAGRNYQAVSELRERKFYFSGIFNGEAENFVGNLITPSNASTNTIATPNLDPNGGQAVVEIGLQGIVDTAHNVQIKLNNTTTLGAATFNGTQRNVTRFSVPVSLLNTTGNQIALAATASQSDVSGVDYIRITYPHLLRADANLVALTNTRINTTLNLDGFTNTAVRAFDVSNPSSPVALAVRTTERNANDFTATVSAKPATRAAVIALTDDKFLSPLSVTRNEASAIATDANGADYVVIAHKDFKNNLTELIALRANQGLQTKIVDVENVFDEFSFGAQAASGIRNFLKHAADTWTTKPRFVLLVGDASFDPRGYDVKSTRDFIPTRLYDSAFMETAADSWLSDFNDDGVQNIATGRLPVQNANDLQTMIEKIIAYEASGNRGAAGRGILIVADKIGSDGYNFEQDARRVADDLPANVSHRLIVRPTDGAQLTATRQEVKTAIDTGFSVVNWVGHGAINKWAGDGLLTNTDAPTLENQNRYAVFLMMTCYNGWFVTNTQDSLGEALLKARNTGTNANVGAVAVWASSGLTIPIGQNIMNRKFYQEALGANAVTIGEADIRAKLSMSDMDVRRTWNLLGDPAIYLR